MWTAEIGPRAERHNFEITGTPAEPLEEPRERGSPIVLFLRMLPFILMGTDLGKGDGNGLTGGGDRRGLDLSRIVRGSRSWPSHSGNAQRNEQLEEEEIYSGRCPS